jgi:bacteriocin biosynthesis cyclodehydratase domain-containing protein
VKAGEHRDPRASRGAGGRHREELVIAAADAPPAGGALRYRLLPSIEVLEASDGCVYLLRPGSDPDIAVRDPSPGDRELLATLARGPAVVAPESLPRLRPLIAAGVVVEATESPPLKEAEARRFARQLPYLAEFGDPARAQRRLRDATIVLLGCGGLGTWVLGALACVGIGRVILIDDDHVELSNLNRQVLYRAADVGRPKVALAAAWATAFDPAIEARAVSRRVGGPGDLADVLPGADALVLAADRPRYALERWVNAACLAAGVPFITAGHQPPLLRIGPLYLWDGGPCFECHERQLRAGYPLYDEVVGARLRESVPDTTLGPASGVVGTLVAMEMLHMLVRRERPATSGRALLMDMRTLEARWEAVERDAGCPSCGAR